MRQGLWVGALLLATVAAWGWNERERAPADLPPEAVATLARIEAGGPFAYRQDGNQICICQVCCDMGSPVRIG